MSDIQATFQLQRPDFTLDVDLTLPGRGVTALFGDSGSGKTTLLRCLAGLQRADRGYLTFQDEVWQDAQHTLPPHRRPLGYVFQETSLFPHLNVQQNIEYGQKRSATPLSASQLAHLLDLLGIAHLLPRKPAQLSGGERQRVGIARALAVNPRWLLLDEPLAALDAARKREILSYLARLRDELEIPLLYVSHAPEEVAQLADYLVVLERGRVAMCGPLRDTLTRLDGPLAQFDEAAAVLHTRIGAQDDAYHLTRLDFAGGALWVSRQTRTLGSPLRVRILARDVSLALHAPRDSSINNLLIAHIVNLRDSGPDQVNVLLACGEQPLLARITRRSRDQLALTPGMTVVAQVKSVALL